MNKIVTFPRMGIYTDIFKELIENLGVEVMLPPPITDKTIKLGVRYSSAFMCYPFKICLGSLIEALEIAKQKEIKLTYIGIGTSNTCMSSCRFQLYFEIHKRICEDLGYDFNTLLIERKGPRPIGFILGVINTFKKLNPENSYLKVIKEIANAIKKMKEEEKKTDFKWDNSNNLRIGVVGEFYSVVEPFMNYNVMKRLRERDINVHTFVKYSNELVRMHKEKVPEEFVKQAKNYFHGTFRAHGDESYHALYFYKHHDFDAVFHFTPVSCLTENTNITLEDYTSKSIKDIKIGDKILTHKGRFKRVIKVFNRYYKGEIINIDCGGLSKLCITPEHPVLVLKREKIKCRSPKKKIMTVCRPNKIETNLCKEYKCRKGKFMNFNPTFIEANTLSKGDFIAIPKPKIINNNHFFELNKLYDMKPKWEDIKKYNFNPENLKILGYYLAEGCLRYDPKRGKQGEKLIRGINFTFNKNEERYVNEIISIIEKNFKTKISKRTSLKRPNVLGLYIGNRNLADIFLRLCGEYCDKKKIHEDLMNLSPKLQLEIIKGFFRGDGSLSIQNNRSSYRGVTTSFNLANQLFWILIRNNIKSTISEQNIKNRKKSFMIKISNSKSINRLNDEEIPFINRIDNARFIETSTYFLIPVKKIEKKEFDGDVYNLEVEEDNSFIANNLTVHNCMPQNTAQMIMDLTAKRLDIPLYTFPMDEDNFETGFEMRINSILSILENKKNGI